MFTKKAKTSSEQVVPERVTYTKWYEHDGALRAYANRAMVLACAMTALAFLGVGFGIYVRLQPPTIIRIAPDGESTVISGRPLFHRAAPAVLADLKTSAEPLAYEKEAFIRQFIEHYLSYDAHTVPTQWAAAVNMMTDNLRRSAVRVMQKENSVGKIEDGQVRSLFHLRGIEVAKYDPMTFTVYGVREIHRMDEGRELVERTVNQYRIRLADQGRSVDNPSGLLIGEYSEEQIDGQKKAALLAADTEGARYQTEQ
jgi:hypothetical protein